MFSHRKEQCWITHYQLLNHALPAAESRTNRCSHATLTVPQQLLNHALPGAPTQHWPSHNSCWITHYQVLPRNTDPSCPVTKILILKAPGLDLDMFNWSPAILVSLFISFRQVPNDSNSSQPLHFTTPSNKLFINLTLTDCMNRHLFCIYIKHLLTIFSFILTCDIYKILNNYFIIYIPTFHCKHLWTKRRLIFKDSGGYDPLKTANCTDICRDSNITTIYF